MSHRAPLRPLSPEQTLTDCFSLQMGVIKVEAEKRGYKDQQAVCAHIAELEGPVTDGVFNQCGAQGIPGMYQTIIHCTKGFTLRIIRN